MREVLGRVTMQVFVCGNCTMIAAPVQCDVDGIPKGSHFRSSTIDGVDLARLARFRASKSEASRIPLSIAGTAPLPARAPRSCARNFLTTSSPPAPPAGTSESNRIALDPAPGSSPFHRASSLPMNDIPPSHLKIHPLWRLPEQCPALSAPSSLTNRVGSGRCAFIG